MAKITKTNIKYLLIVLVVILSLSLGGCTESSESASFFRGDDFSETRSYEDTGDLDCSDFSYQEDAQSFFESQGGPGDDFHNLDRDGDGEACETLP